jgi:hypothetical protein
MSNSILQDKSYAFALRIVMADGKSRSEAESNGYIDS